MKRESVKYTRRGDGEVAKERQQKRGERDTRSLFLYSRREGKVMARSDVCDDQTRFHWLIPIHS